MIYLDPWIGLIGLVFAVYGVERMFIDVVRFVDRRMGHKPKGPTGFIPPKG